MLIRSRIETQPRIINLGRIAYADAYALQLAHHEEVLAARESATPDPGRILLVEHDPPVITISKRADAPKHLLATPRMLEQAGVTVAETDRGGDITYHGPGQLVVYPILDLNVYHLRLHDYMRLLEQSIIDAIAEWGVTGERDPSATGVWVRGEANGAKGSNGANAESDRSLSAPFARFAPFGPSKVAALGVRIRRWVSMHGLALNITTNLDHFGLIVPCGLAGRPVTSLHRLLGDRCPSMEDAKSVLCASLVRNLHTHAAARPPARAENTHT